MQIPTNISGKKPNADWPHAPTHRFVPGAAYMVTAGTYQKIHYFNSPERLNLLRHELFAQCADRGWKLQAWAILANHYHFIATAPENPDTLKPLIRALHSKTAIALNKADNTLGRKIWFQYWDSCITHEKGYLARLHYVHQNPVRHGIVKNAEDYAWCSMRWFREQATGAFQKTVSSFKTDRIEVPDDF